MKSGKSLIPKGLTGKLIRVSVCYVLAMAVFFMAIFGIRLAGLRKMIKSTKEKQMELISAKLGQSMTDITEENLKSLIITAIERTDDEFVIAKQDLITLRDQAEDVFAHPENYKPKEIYPPDKENGDTPMLQLLAPNGYENISPETYDMMQRLANLEPIMRQIVLSEDYIIDSYISTLDGVTLTFDRLSEGKFDENGEIKKFDARERGWFKGALESGDVFFSATVKSSLYGFRELVYSIPVYKDGKPVAVIEGCLHIEAMSAFMQDNEREIGKTGFSILISKEGQLSESKRQTGELMMPDDITVDIRDRVNPELKAVIDKGLQKQTGIERVHVDGDEYYAAYGYLPTSGWAQIIFVSVPEVEEPIGKLLADIEEDTVKIWQRENMTYLMSVLISIISFLLILTIANNIVAYRAKKRAVPIVHMTERLREISGANMFFEMEDIYRTGDEIEVLAGSFETMAEKMRNYVDEIIDGIAEKERVKTELSLASKIQADMLPSVFPAFPDRNEFDIYAGITLAKEVGGDFYDFFFIGEQHLAMVMADVSGKGVPAAMFMMMVKSMIRVQILAGNDPGTALENVNDLINSNNREKMFVTVWIGILNVATGVITASNAGHEKPILKKPDGDFEVLNDKHGFVIGGIENMKYTNYEIVMKPGSKLFLYTDGVLNAVNSEGRSFGIDRTLAAINLNAGSSAKDIIESVNSEIRMYGGNKEQVDDLTMMCFEYLGGSDPEAYEEITMDATSDSITKTQEFIANKLDILESGVDEKRQIDVAIDEIVGNIASYAYEGGTGPVTVGASIDISHKTIEIIFKDKGVYFNPLDKEAPDVSLAAKKRKIGGLGIFLVKKTMDDMQYEYTDGQNILKLVKKVNKESLKGIIEIDNN